MTTYDNLDFYCETSFFGNAFAAEGLVVGYRMDAALLPAGQQIKLFGNYSNDPGISSIIRARFQVNIPPDNITAGTLLLQGNLAPGAGTFSFVGTMPAVAGIGVLGITFERGGGAFDQAGLQLVGLSVGQFYVPVPPAPPHDPGGFGSEAFGDPFGAGGPLHVVRARVIDGQTLRVVFDEEPVHVSAGGQFDALNPSNYDVRITNGQGVDPEVVGVKPRMRGTEPIPPYAPIAETAVNGNLGERAFDIQVDRPLIRTLSYEVTAVRIRSKFGGSLGIPFTANAPGIVLLQNVIAPQAVREVNDIFNDPITGGYVVDGSGDIGNQDQLSSYKKRILRRLMTVKNAFRALPGYGISADLKAPMSLSRVAELKADIIQQVSAEPETQSVNPTMTVDARGFLEVQLSVRTKKGAFVQFTVSGPTGEISVS